MKLNYKEKKVLSEEEMSQETLEFALEDAALNLRSDILATKRSLSKAKKELAEAKTLYPLDVQYIMDKTAELEGWKTGLKTLLELQKELGFKEEK